MEKNINKNMKKIKPKIYTLKTTKLKNNHPSLDVEMFLDDTGQTRFNSGIYIPYDMHNGEIDDIADSWLTVIKETYNNPNGEM